MLTLQLKKILKNLAKVGTLGALAYGATKLGRKRATDSASDALAKAKQALTSDAAYSDQTMPGNLSPDMGSREKWRMPDDPRKFSYPHYKKGGRVKSMGIAKRGGGAAKR